jgi:hypothetical protein
MELWHFRLETPDMALKEITIVFAKIEFFKKRQCFITATIVFVFRYRPAGLSIVWICRTIFEIFLRTLIVFPAHHHYSKKNI